MPAYPSRVEFIALIAMLFATIAFSIDGMLPALTTMAQELSPDSPNKVQMVVTSFVLGMGVGTLFTGPLSDALGRKPVVLGGAALYILAAFAATLSNNLDGLLLARVIQGLGAAGPRIAAMAIIRDRYAGRGMAQIMSFVMLVFAIVPAIAPSIGAVILAFAGWRAVFWGFILFAALAALWLAIRMPETLPREDRRPFRLGAMREALAEMWSFPMIRLSIIVQGLCYGILFSMIATVQPIYDVTFGRGAEFPLWFGGIAVVASSGSIVNGLLVMRLGMRKLVARILWVQVVLSAVMLMLVVMHVAEPVLFGAFVIWQTSVFFQAGLTFGNLNALAMEPVGHIAGLAASIIGAVATVAAVILTIPVTLFFDGTAAPIATATLFYAVIAALITRRMAVLERVTS